MEKKTFSKAALSWDCFFEDDHRGGIWREMPHDICKLLEKPEGPLSSITDYLVQNKRYKITITIEEIENK